MGWRVRRGWRIVIVGCAAVLLAAGGWLWLRAPAHGGVPAAKIASLLASAPPARLSPGSGPGPWLLAGGAFPSSKLAFAVGDAGVGPDPRDFPCPVTIGLSCAGGGFVLASADGGRTWRQVYHGTAQLEGIQAWPGGAALAWGPEALLRSGGGGSAWRALALPGPGEIVWASFASPAGGWVSLDNGCTSSHGLLLQCQDAVFATADGGRNWRIIAHTASYPRPAPGAKLLVRQSVAGRDLGGGDGWLRDTSFSYVTTDGGRTWTASAAGAGILGALMTSPLRGWRLSDLPPSGQDSTTTEVLATTDGGRTWFRVGRVGQVVAGLRAGGGSLWAIAAEHRDVGEPGWACASTLPHCGPAVWVSANGGRTWSRRPTADTAVGWVAPLDSRRAVAGALGPGGRDRLLLTQDGGRTWTPVATGGPAPGPSLRVGFWSSLRGWGNGLPQDPAATLFTSDGGRTWRRGSDLPPGTYDAVFRDPLHGWAEVATPAWRETADGGKTWRRPPAAPAGNALAGFNLATFGRSGLSALTAGRGAGSGGALSTDGGRTWSPVPVPEGTAVLRFASASVGWAIREVPAAAPQTPPTDLLLRTTDGGRTWRRLVRLPNSGALPLVAAPTPRDLWVVTGGAGRWLLLRTLDGGARWTGAALPAPLADTYLAGDRLSAVGADDGWLLTHSGLWRTTDGGGAWTRVSEP